MLMDRLHFKFDCEGVKWSGGEEQGLRREVERTERRHGGPVQSAPHLTILTAVVCSWGLISPALTSVAVK